MNRGRSPGEITGGITEGKITGEFTGGKSSGGNHRGEFTCFALKDTHEHFRIIMCLSLCLLDD